MRLVETDAVTLLMAEDKEREEWKSLRLHYTQVFFSPLRGCWSYLFRCLWHIYSVSVVYPASVCALSAPPPRLCGMKIFHHLLSVTRCCSIAEAQIQMPASRDTLWSSGSGVKMPLWHETILFSRVKLRKCQIIPRGFGPHPCWRLRFTLCQV